MNAASEFDLGPLTWVKTEIDLALERATAALTQYAGSNDVTHLKFARTHIHQAHGALDIVGLDGVTQVTESLEALLVLLETGQSTAAAAIFDAFESALAAIQQYLDDLLNGAANQPLRLLPAYTTLAEARGISNSHAADLFYPDLSGRPEKRLMPPPVLEPEALKTLLKSERARYQKALLTWLKKPDEAASALASFRQALSSIEGTQDSASNRTFWWISQAFIETLKQPEIAADPRARQLCSHIDGQIRRLLEGNHSVAERLLRDALYFVAQAPAGQHPQLDELQAAFNLAALLPDANASSAPQAHDSDLRHLRETLLASEESWNKFCSGCDNSLTNFAEQARHCNTLTNEIGHTDLKRLGQAFAAVANWLAETPSKQSDNIAMEVATAILLMQNALENFRHLSTDFAQQVDLMVARLYGCITGKTAAEQGLPALDEITRQAQEKLLITHVAREILNNLAQVEQSLDRFFRDPSKTAELATVDGPLKQIAGALTMLGHFGAVSHLNECVAQIRRFAEADYTTTDGEFEALARQLSLLGFFVDALEHGETSYEAFLSRVENPATVTNEEDSDNALPIDARAELQHAALATPEPETAASHAAIDSELLEIFLEEAHSVLDTMAEQLAALQAAPHHLDALTVIRRGAHTLKGSGRMVGLHELGDAAWEIEQTLNLWLRQEQAVNADLLSLLAEQHQLFTLWVDALENQRAAPNPAAMVALAQQLRGCETLAPLTVQPEPVPEPLVANLDDEKLNATADALADLLSDSSTPSADHEMSRSTPEIEEISPPISSAPTLYDIFCEEARGHLQTLLSGLADLETSPASPTTFAMTRAAHTLGGTAATVGLMPLNHLALALEHALLRRDGSANPASAADLASLRLAIDTLAAQFAALADQTAPEEQGLLIATLETIYPAAPAEAEAEAEAVSDETIAVASSAIEEVSDESIEVAPLNDELDEQLLPLFLDEAQEQLPALSAQVAAWRLAPDQSAAAYAIARLLHTFKGNARMAGAMNLGEFAHLLESRVEEALRSPLAPSELLDEIENGFDTLALAVERLRAERLAPSLEANSTESIESPANTAEPAEAESDSGQQHATLRVPAKLIDQLVNEAGELSIARTRIEGEMRSLKSSLLDLTENVIRLRRQLREIEIQAEGQIQAHVAQSPEGDSPFDPLELDRFTRFQELTRFMAESVNDVATVQQNLLKNVDDANAAILAQSRLNRNLQQELMGVRMLPFNSQSERLYRIVRQTAKDVGKRANLDIVGGQVEMDRSVLDKMLAPLEHMLRNAITHGIENREQREAAGKPEVGEITVSLTQEGNEIILSMVDDGKGLDSTAIRTRAEAMGLLAAGQLIDESSLFDFIFQPGFSTASELTQLAGRGVGMDVVKTEVTALGGRIEIIAQAGKGTTFRLYLPLTLAVTQTLLLRAGNNLYAIPSTMIEQVLELKEKPLSELRQKGEVEWLGNRYSFHFLPHLLGDSSAVPEAHRQYWVLLLRSGTQRVAVLVDELKGNQEVVVKNIGAQLARVVGIAGATVLGDGKVVLILNPVALASRHGGLSVSPAAPDNNATPVASSTPKLPTIMVVDDSLTVRKFTSRLLSREGYQVVLAKDGVDALEQLVDALPDVIISDIEMPRMDGFDLLRNLRADERLNKLPIIMITSRTADKHRNHALELGANHYLGKPYDEDELLRLLASHIKS